MALLTLQLTVFEKQKLTVVLARAIAEAQGHEYYSVLSVDANKLRNDLQILLAKVQAAV